MLQVAERVANVGNPIGYHRQPQDEESCGSPHSKGGGHHGPPGKGFGKGGSNDVDAFEANLDIRGDRDSDTQTDVASRVQENDFYIFLRPCSRWLSRHQCIDPDLAKKLAAGDASVGSPLVLPA